MRGVVLACVLALAWGSPPKDICRNAGTNHIILPHEKCNKFYTCSANKVVVLTCPRGLLYNAATEACDYPENVVCSEKVPEGESWGSDSGEGSNDIGDNSNNHSEEGNDSSDAVDGGNWNPSEAGEICAADDSDSVLVAHENCNKFYKCSHGFPIAIKCQNGLLYNPEKEWCDWPENVNCGDRIIPEGGNGGDGDNNGNGNGEDHNGGGGDNSGNGNGEDNNGGGNSDPSEAPAICAADDSDSILVANENCNKFYICSQGVPVALKCPNGLLYNPSSESCDWPENVNCGDRIIPEGGSGEGGENGGHGNGEGGNNSDSGENNGSGDNSGDNENNNGGGNWNPSEAPEICAADDSDGTLVANENCNKFYKCSHGFPVAISCQNGLLYNVEKEWCDWPENVNCGDRIIPEGGNGGDGDNNGNGNGEDHNGGGGDNSGNGNGEDNNGGGNSDPSEAPAICAADDSDSILVANENCNKFYICSQGVPVALKCPNGLLYNPSFESCDWPENVNCGDRIIPEGGSEEGGENGGHGNGEGGNNSNSGENNGGGDSSGDNENNNNGGGNWNPSEAPEICAADDSDGILVANEHCNKFYKCSHGFPVAISCQNGLLYNPEKEWCDWPENVNCGDRIIPEGGNGGDGDNNGNGNGEDHNGGGGDNSGNGNGEDNNGGGNSDPSEAPAICAADDSDSILVANENCNKFYICSQGVPVALKCPNGLLYNPSFESCDWPENVNCGDRIIPEGGSGEGGESGGNGNGEGGNNSNSGENNGSGDNSGDNENNNNGGGNWNPSEAPEICAADDSDGILIANEHCNKFYKCSHGFPVAISCQNGLLYNPEKEWCDWPENVNCGDRIIPEGGNGGDGDNNGNGNGEDHNGGGGDNSGNGNGEDNNGGGNSDPSEAPAICAADDSDSILVANENCNKFYICSQGVPVALKCPNGLLYNPSSESCDWPENVNCGDRIIPEGGSGEGGESGGNGNGEGGNNSDSGENNGSGDNSGDNENNNGGGNWNPSEAPEICAADDSDGTLVANENCNKFYKCSHGFPVAISCQNGLLYNVEKEWCDWPENVNCGDRIIPEGGNGGDGDNNGNGNGEDHNGGGGDNSGNGNGEDNNGGGNSDPSEAPAICAADDSDSILVANENCNKFYICSQGVPVALKCPNGLLYNPSSESCDWPENVNCGDRIIPEGGSEEGGENGGHGNGEGGNNSNSGENNGGGDSSGDNENNNNGGGNWNPSEAPEICAADDSDGILVANEHCNKFYKCSHGFPVAISCQNGLLYNPEKEWCDWPENVNCGDRIIPEGGNGGDGDNNGNGNGEDHNGGGGDNSGNGNGEDNNGGGNSDPSEAPAICAADDSDSILVAHEKCNKFYVCSQGLPVTLKCPQGLLYNPRIESCDWPENVNCGDRIIPEGGSGEGGESGGNGNGEGGNNSNSGENNGSGDNSGDNENNNGGGNWNPSEAPEICAADDSDGILVANENCNKFYKCSHGFPVAIKCQNGLLYNVEKEWCDWPENVNCGDRIIPEGGNGGDGDNNGNGEDHNGGGGDNNGNGNGEDNNGGGNSDPSEAPAICAADDSDSILVAHEKCNKFYVCSQGLPVTLKCPQGLLYNPRIESCDWPENVNCGDRIIPEGGSGEGGESGGNGNGEGGNNSDSGENNGSGDNSGDNENNNGGGNWNPSEAPEICAADDSDGILVANENCNKFYKCSHGFPVAIKCQNGLLYNVEKEWCDWPENVNCGDRIIPEGGNGGDGDNNGNGEDHNGGGGDNNSNGNGEDNNGGGNSDPSEAPAICAADDSDSILVAHEKCNKFYVCSQGLPVTLKCPQGLLYNPRIESCDWPENVNCGDRIIPEGGSGEGGESGGNGNGEGGNNSNSGENNGSGDNSGDNENNNGGGNWNPSEAPEICAADGSEGILVANENCNKFYKCSHGFPVAIKCQNGLLYNVEKEWCDWPENVNCGDRIISEGGNGGDGDTNGNGNGESDNDNGGGNSDPSKAPEICAADDSDSVLVAHENCNEFYICNQGEPVTLRCPKGLLYSPGKEVCDWPENVDCSRRISSRSFYSVNKHLRRSQTLYGNH